MTESTKDKIQGSVHEAKGALKEKVGRATNDPDMEAEGSGENLSGKVQKKIGDIKKVFEK